MNRECKMKDYQAGFTLVELLVVLVILMVVGAISVGSFLKEPDKAKRHLLEALADAPRFRAAHQLLLKMREQAGAPVPLPTLEEALQ